MPSTSKAQQRLMGMAYALKKGDMEAKDASQEVKDLADSMTLQQLKDFASTSHEGLPEHTDEAKVNEWLPGVSAGHKWYTQASQGAMTYGSQLKDHTDNLVQSFIEFIDTGKKPKTVSDAAITEDAGAVAPAAVSAPQASTANTPGMGNVSAPGPGKIGSGDKFGDDDEDEDDVENQHGIVSYEQFKKKFLTSGKGNK
jgi:hypothetical protein